MPKISQVSSITPQLLEIHKPHNEFTSVGLIIAIVLYTAAVAAKIGTGNLPSILPLILSVTITLLPEVFASKSGLSLPLLQMLVLVLFFIVGWISILFEIDLTIVLYFSFAASVYFFSKKIGVTIAKVVIIKWLLVFCLSMVLLKQVWTHDYLNPLAPEAFAAGLGYVHIDTFFLATITAMIKTYQVTSTGLFGLEVLTYHMGSNFVFASFAELCKVDILQFYNIGFPVIFVPLFCQGMLYCSVSNTKIKGSYLRIPVIIITLFFILSELVGGKIGTKFFSPTTYNSHLISQSYCLSLVYTFFAIAIYYPFLLKGRPIHHNKIVQIILISIIPVWIFIIGYTKISTGVMVFTAFIYLVVRQRLFLQKWVALTSVISTLVLLYVYVLAADVNENTYTFQFGVYYDYIKDGAIPYFLFNYWPSILFSIMVFVVYRERSSTIYHNLISGKFILIETIVVVSVVGILPSLIFNIESSGYFADVQYWLSSIGIMGLMPHFIYILYQRKKGAVKFVRAFIVLAIIVVAFTGIYTFVRRNFQARSVLVYGQQVKFSELMKTISWHDLFIKLGLELKNSESYQQKMQSNLNLPLFESLRKLPRDTRAKSVIYCEDPIELASFLECPAILFYIPAMSEMPMINGLFWRECISPTLYMMPIYEKYPTLVTHEEAYQFAKEKGFSNVIVINLKGRFYKIVKL